MFRINFTICYLILLVLTKYEFSYALESSDEIAIIMDKVKQGSMLHSKGLYKEAWEILQTTQDNIKKVKKLTTNYIDTLNAKSETHLNKIVKLGEQLDSLKKEEQELNLKSNTLNAEIKGKQTELETLQQALSIKEQELQQEEKNLKDREEERKSFWHLFAAAASGRPEIIQAADSLRIRELEDKIKDINTSVSSKKSSILKSREVESSLKDEEKTILDKKNRIIQKKARVQQNSDEAKSLASILREGQHIWEKLEGIVQYQTEPDLKKLNKLYNQHLSKDMISPNLLLVRANIASKQEINLLDSLEKIGEIAKNPQALLAIANM